MCSRFLPQHNDVTTIVFVSGCSDLAHDDPFSFLPTFGVWIEGWLHRLSFDHCDASDVVVDRVCQGWIGLEEMDIVLRRGQLREL